MSVESATGRGKCSSNVLLQLSEMDGIYAVTCYHFMRQSGLPDLLMMNGNRPYPLVLDGSIPAELVAGSLNEIFDFALIKMNADVAAPLLSNCPKLCRLESLYDESAKEVATEFPQTRIISETALPVSSGYVHTYRGLLAYVPPNQEHKKGDSGQVVVIESGAGHQPLGWLLGKDEHVSYLLPFQRLGSFLKRVIKN